MPNYTVLHCHTEQSLLDSVTNYKDYVNKAVELGQKAIAFTEHGNTFTWIEKKMYCDKMGIKYIHGIEIYLTESLEEKVRDNYHTILLAKNKKGFQELNRLVDLSTQDSHFYYKPRLSFDEFLNISDNIIKTSACLQSPLNRDRESYLYEKLCNKYDYFEIQPHVNSEEQKEFNDYLFKLSKMYNKPLVACTDTHSLNKYKAECRTIIKLAKQKSNKKVSESMSDEFDDKFDLTYKSYDEVINMFEAQGVLPMDVVLEAIENTNIISDSIEPIELDYTQKYPHVSDDDEKSLWQTIDDKYKYKVDNGIIKDDNRYKEEIAEEMRVFKKINMHGFILFMSQMMTWCRDNDIPVGPARGSVAGSTVAYITDITDVDPVKWGTVFSRFANEDRTELGDIDADWAPDQRELVYNYIINRFGNEYATYIMSNGTLAGKSVVDEVGRALCIPLDEVAHIKEVYNEDIEKARKEYPNVFYYYDGLEGCVISQSIHPAGMIASPVNLVDNYGTFYNREGKHILSINMEECHEVSLVKYDILGLKNIQIISDTCKLAGIKYPLSHEINWDDESVWKDILSSNIGIFQFESPYAFDLMKSYIPHTINELSMLNAALRPAGASYRDGLINHIENKNPSKEIDDLLKDNHGYLVFQEDVIKFLKDICGLSGSEADNVRRAIGRKQVDRLEAAMPSILEGYCNTSSKPKEEAEKDAKQFLKIIEDSSNYMFGFNHSTGYSMISYLCAYYRYYYPVEFVTAYLNNAQNREDLNNGRILAQIKNIKIKTPKFGKSKSDYMIGVNEENTIYKGIGSIKGFSVKSSMILEELGKNKYDNFYELLKTMSGMKGGVSKDEIESLIIIGYFSDYGTRSGLLKMYGVYKILHGKKSFSKVRLPISDDGTPFSEELIRKFCEKETNKTLTKFDEDGLFNMLTPLMINIPDSPIRILNWERETMGSPSTIYKDSPDDLYFVNALDNRYNVMVELYKINSGESVIAKVRKKVFEECGFTYGEILKIKLMNEEAKYRYIGVNSNGSNKFERDYNSMELILKKYSIVNL